MYQVEWSEKGQVPLSAKNIRKAVFEDEQGFQNEFDEIDKFAFHMIISDDSGSFATGRLFQSENGEFKIGRIAIILKRRGQGLGKLVMTELVKKAAKLGAHTITLDAQVRAAGFYEKCGFNKIKGTEYLEGHCPHVAMKMTIDALGNTWETQKIKGVIFDVDGTALDTLGDITYSFNKVLEEFGYPHEFTTEQLKKILGKGSSYLIRAGLPEDCTEELVNTVLTRYKVIYDQNIVRSTVPYNGINELLEKLLKNGIRLGVLSNKPHKATEKLINTIFPNIPFSPVWGQRDNFPTKPDVLAAKGVAEIMGIECENIAFVGDSDIDMITATNSGMIPVGVLWGFRGEIELLENGAKHIIKNPLELLDLI